MIRVVISKEALEDYARGSDGVRLGSDEPLSGWLKQQLLQFDPHHDATRGDRGSI
jgi:hypothetical protein